MTKWDEVFARAWAAAEKVDSARAWRAAIAEFDLSQQDLRTLIDTLTCQIGLQRMSRTSDGQFICGGRVVTDDTAIEWILAFVAAHAAAKQAGRGCQVARRAVARAGNRVRDPFYTAAPECRNGDPVCGGHGDGSVRQWGDRYVIYLNARHYEIAREHALALAAKEHEASRLRNRVEGLRSDPFWADR